MADSLPRRWYQEPYVWLLLAIPLSAVVVGMIMLWLALHSEHGLVVDDYYKRGLEINRTLQRDIVARQHGLNAIVKFSTDFRNVHVTVHAAPEFDYPQAIQLGLYHATRSGLDRKLSLSRSSDKGYSGNLPDLVPGRWYLTLWSGQWRLTGVVRWPTESVSLTFLPDHS